MCHGLNSVPSAAMKASMVPPSGKYFQKNGRRE